MLDFRQTWGEHRVYFRERRRGFCALPATWTDAVEPEPFVVVSRGRAFFTARDLTVLAGLVAELSGAERRKAKSVKAVKQTTPPKKKARKRNGGRRLR